MNRQPIVFSSAKVSLDDWLAAARSLVGIRGSRHRSYIARDERGAIDLVQSSLRCDGVILASAQMCGLLPDDFDLSAARWDAGQTLDDWANAFFERNFFRVTKNAARRGDVLRMLMRDVNPNVTAPHHLAILTDARRDCRALLHVEGAGAFVVETPCDALDWTRVESLWRPCALNWAAF